MTFSLLLFMLLITGFYMAWNIGANDVANAMGTSVGSGALTLKKAVLIAAFLEFSGAFFFGSHVSATLQSGIVNTDIFVGRVETLICGMLAALASAGVCLQLASYLGFPVSTTHAIVGAVVGFGIIAGGLEAIHWTELSFIVTSWILSPLLGGVLAYLLFTLIRKKIFYAMHPLRATAQLLPVLLFFVAWILAMMLVFEGLSNTSLLRDPWEKLFVATFIAFVCGLIGAAILRKLSTAPLPAIAHPPPPEPALINALEKASRHLRRVEEMTEGEVQYRAALLEKESRALLSSLQQAEEARIEQSDYQQVEGVFGYLQVISACMMAFAHGANDVANAIGPFSAAVNALRFGATGADLPVPSWTLALGGFGIVIGLATWGWRVIETVGKKITELTPSRGFAAEFGAATTIVLASRLGLPISTTHTLVGAVVGVGFARGIGAINLAITRDILISWLLTVPLGASIAILLFYPIRAFFG